MGRNSKIQGRREEGLGPRHHEYVTQEQAWQLGEALRVFDDGMHSMLLNMENTPIGAPGKPDFTYNEMDAVYRFNDSVMALQKLAKCDYTRVARDRKDICWYKGGSAQYPEGSYITNEYSDHIALEDLRIDVLAKRIKAFKKVAAKYKLGGFGEAVEQIGRLLGEIPALPAHRPDAVEIPADAVIVEGEAHRSAPRTADWRTGVRDSQTPPGEGVVPGRK